MLQKIDTIYRDILEKSMKVAQKSTYDNDNIVDLVLSTDESTAEVHSNVTGEETEIDTPMAQMTLSLKSSPELASTNGKIPMG